jgi:hypothetical protein
MAMSPAANVVPAFLIDSDRPVDASLVKSILGDDFKVGLSSKRP